MERYTKLQLTKDIIKKLSTTTNTYEVDFEDDIIIVTHIDENGIKYILSVFYGGFILANEIDESFIDDLKGTRIKFQWLRVLERDDDIFSVLSGSGFDDMNFDFIINSLEELAKKKIRLEEEEENKLKNLAKKFGIL